MNEMLKLMKMSKNKYMNNVENTSISKNWLIEKSREETIIKTQKYRKIESTQV
jgi:hypothetical protein